MAETLNQALRNQDRWTEKGGCPREEQFEQLYRVLGDRDAQDRIREKAERRPCYILARLAPDACDCLPQDIGETKTGEPCPNNPYAREAELIAELGEQRPLLELAEYLHEMADLRGIDPAGIMPEEWIAVRIMRQRARYQDLRAMHAGSVMAMPQEEDK